MTLMKLRCSGAQYFQLEAHLACHRNLSQSSSPIFNLKPSIAISNFESIVSPDLSLELAQCTNAGSRSSYLLALISLASREIVAQTMVSLTNEDVVGCSTNDQTPDLEIQGLSGKRRLSDVWQPLVAWTAKQPYPGLGTWLRWLALQNKIGLVQKSVFLASIAGLTRCHYIVPAMATATRLWNNVVDVLSRSPTVLASIAVTCENGPLCEGHTPRERDLDKVRQTNDRWLRERLAF